MSEAKRGRPRIHDDRQKEWKQRTNFEQSEARRKYKADWARRKRQERKQNDDRI